MEEHAGQIPPERPELRAEAEARAAELVSGLLSRDNPFLCCVHPEEEAAASCRRCGRPCRPARSPYILYPAVLDNWLAVWSLSDSKYPVLDGTFLILHFPNHL